MLRFGTAMAVMLMASAGPAMAADEATLGKSKVFLIFEGSGALSDDVSAATGPVEATTAEGRSSQLVVDLVVEADPETTFTAPPVLSLVARKSGGDGRVLAEKSWKITEVGDFGTVIRSAIVDHDCEGVSLEGTLADSAGKPLGSWTTTLEIVCMTR